MHCPMTTIPAGTGRESLCFDFDWRFYLQAPGCDVPGQQPDLDDSGWDLVQTPHDFSILQPFDKDAPAGGSGGHMPGGVGWYRKHFYVPDDLGPRRVWIELDGVYRRSDLWCNGRHVGHRAYGYASFQYDLTDYLRPGQANLIAVRADNADQPNCRWYSGSGIYRHVRMVITEPLAIAPWGVSITTDDELAASARVAVQAELTNATEGTSQVQLQVTILDPDQAPCAHGGGQVEVPAGGRTTAGVSLQIESPRLWSPQTPQLYQAVCEVLDPTGRRLDRLVTTFGVRKVELDNDRGFLLNGRPVKLKGGNIHHDGGCVGAAVPADVWRRRLETIKSLGANMVRMSHNPPAPEVLDLCDRIGLMVYDEAFDKWAAPLAGVPWIANTNPTFEQDWQIDLDAMVLRDRNHPCVAIWSVGNEVVEYGTDPAGCVEIYRRLRDRVRELDACFGPVSSLRRNVRSKRTSPFSLMRRYVRVGSSGRVSISNSPKAYRPA